MVSRKYLILVAMAGMLISFDQLSKFLVTGSQTVGETLPVLAGYLSITLVQNRGAAFGLFSTLPPGVREPLLFAVPGLTLLLIFYVFLRLKEHQKISIYSLSMIMGGAMGNLMDRLRLGYVVDFLDFHWQERAHFPAFNLADCSITLGVAMMVFGLLVEKNEAEY